ncbi:glycosyl transferase [Bacteroidia bacterium]|nr:glycosyl transferase [Bacteroidia bacterium]
MKLSIITINLNNQNGLQKTIESVISQTFEDFEYIVIDGSSVDGSVDVIKQYADKINSWVSEPDTGIYNAMNKGITCAKGEYCLFLNSGDGLLHSNTLSELFAQHFDEDIVYGNVIKCSKSSEELNKGIAKSDISLYDLVVNRINHQACLIKRELFSKFGLYSEDYRIASDWKFFLDTIIVGNVSIKYVDMNISFFDEEGVSSTNRGKAHEETMGILQSTIPARILSDIKELDRYKRSTVVKMYDKLLKNKILLKIYNRILH